MNEIIENNTNENSLNINHIKSNLEDITYISKYLNSEKENISYINKNNNKTLFYFFNKEIYNNKGTKLINEKNKEDFLSLINILNEYIEQKEEFYILTFFEKINVQILKVIINGYINFDYKQNEMQYNIIKKIVPFFFDKNLFYYIYNKLSKIFRRFSLYENKNNLFNKFTKIMDIWSLLYKIENISKVNISFVSLIGNNNISLKILNDKIKIKSIKIIIEFEPFFPFDINSKIDDFDFLKIYYKLSEPKEVKINHIMIEKEEKISKILFKIKHNYYYYNINDELDEKNNEIKKNIIKDRLSLPDENKKIIKVEILNNYIGAIKDIKIIIKDDNEKIEYNIKDKNQNNFFVKSNYENKQIEENFNVKFKANNIVGFKKSNEIYYEDIRYYGGMECFIPIFKIIKYFIVEFKDNYKEINLLNKYNIEIITVIINLILYSRKNFINFKNILVPFLGGLAEINHVLSKNFQNELYNNSVFSSLYIIIASSSVPVAVKKAYVMITGLNDANKLNINFNELIIDINLLNNKSLRWYSIILYLYIGFVLLILKNYNKIPKIIMEQLIKVYENNIDKDFIYNSLIKLFIGTLNYICQDEKENIFKNYDKINNLSSIIQNNNFKHLDYFLFPILFIFKSFLNIIDFKKISFEDIDNKVINNNNITEINTEKNFENKIFNNIDNLDNNIENNTNIHSDNKILINDNDNSFKFKFKNLIDSLENFFNNNNNLNANITGKIKKTFKIFIKHKDYLKKLFHLINEHEFEFESDMILEEFIDYHKSYHKLMKNLFIFNRLWSDKKLYFTEEKKKLLKYKYINYYTTNFQRPLLFPINDYKYSYPKLTDFKIKEGFYYVEENKDDYNFSLDCPELDEFSINYENILFKIIEKNFLESIQIYNVCLVKRTHHVKGRLYISNKNGLYSKFLFCSFPYDIAIKKKSCNVTEGLKHFNHNKEKICFGSIFVCPKKEMNQKILIDISNIRLMLLRIYFYRKTGIEIFTNVKSYYFNFSENSQINPKKGEIHCQNIINTMGYFYKTDFFPIKINQNLVGYSREFNKIISEYAEKDEKHDLMVQQNKFMSILFDHWKLNEEGLELSTLDMIIYLNLLSNRSYIDLFQYPIFPLLYFYKKEGGNIKEECPRVLDQHIGFQNISEKSQLRKNIIIRTFEESLREIEENKDNMEEYEKPIYFKTHYSNNVYTCNFLIRLFPFSFLCIELQGDNFDDPNRLFFSIKETFYNISYHKSDLRELIPEFYYFPEMFLNINKIDFHERANGIRVDDVEMPNLNDDDKNNLNNAIKEEKYEKSKNYKCFRFVEKMRNLLESRFTEINYWINIIFGPKQRYDNFSKKGQYFRDETYVGFSEEKEKELDKFKKDSYTMISVEFGISPVQTLFNEKEILNYKNRNVIYDKDVTENKELYKNLCKKFINEINIKKEENSKKNIQKNKVNNKLIIRSSRLSLISSNSRIIINQNEKNERVDTKNEIKYNFKEDKIELNGYKTGKVDIIINGILFDELYDHNDEIISINYNKRLNMFCTSSKDGFLNVYMYPNKLISSLKNSNGNYFDMIFLSSNPFPSIIAFEEKSYELSSYSINGFFITKISLFNLLDIKNKKEELSIFPHFNTNGGTYKDRLFFITENIKEKIFKCQIFTVPFFDREEKRFEIKNK